MSTVNYSAYKTMLGQHNLGSVRLNEKGDALELVNNHKYATWKNGVASSPEENERVRRDFYRSIEAYVSSCGFSTGDAHVKAFLEEVSRDLTGAESIGDDLSRSADLARIVDKVDTAILSGDFSIERPEAVKPNDQPAEPQVGEAPQKPVGRKPLSQRFVMVANKVNVNPGQNAVDGKDQFRLRKEQTLAAIRGLLNPEKDHNKTLVNYLSNATGLSKTQVLTYLKTRPESLMAQARKTIESDRFQQQVSGKNEAKFAAAVDNGRLAQALISTAMQEIHGEKLSDIAVRSMNGTEKAVYNILSGQSEVPVRKLLANKEFVPFMKALNAIADPATTGRFAFTMLGKKVSVGRTPDGVAYCRMGNAGFKLRSQDMDSLKSNLIGQLAVEDGIRVKDLKGLYAKDFLGSEPFGKFRETVSRAVLGVYTGLPSLRLQSLSGMEVKRYADQIIAGKAPSNLKELIVEGCTRMYSPDTIDMIDAFENSRELQASVSFRNPAEKPTGLNSLVSDMFLNANVWKMDTEADAGGQLVESLADNLPALKELQNGNVDELVKTLPPIGDQAKDLKDVLADLKTVLKGANLGSEQKFRAFCDKNRPAFSAMAKKIDEIAEKAIGHFQDVFSKSLNAALEVTEDNRPVKSKTLRELSQEQRNGTKSPEAKFMRALLNEYLPNTAPKVKRAMMASLFRAEGGGNLSNAQQLGALFKGAGPIFQKFLQGLPASSIPEEMRAVVADMKTNLAPIPEKVVLAQLAQVVKESKGAIKSISVDKTLGSASVGQAFLCTLTDQEGQTRQCVIKMLKPDVQNNYSREIDIINNLADAIDKKQNPNGTAGATKKTLQARLDSIKTELDLTVEGKQVEVGQVYNQEGNTKAKARNADLVAGMKLVDGIVSKTNLIALELADGKTLDASLGDANALLTEFSEKTNSLFLKTPIYRWKGDGGSYLEMKKKLVAMGETLAQKQKLMVACAQKWFNEAIYGSGFVHGDVHAGNVVLADKGDKITIIDYGNALTLKKSEQEALQNMTAYATAGRADKFVSSLFKAIEEDPNLNRMMTEDDVTDDENLMENLRDVFAKGDESDAVDRMTIAIGMLREKGVAVPGAIYNFLEGMQRVKNAVADVTDTCDRINSTICGFTPKTEYYFTEADRTEKGRKIANGGWAGHLLPLALMVEASFTEGPGGSDFANIASDYYGLCDGKHSLDSLVAKVNERSFKGKDDGDIREQLDISYEVVLDFVSDPNEKAELEKSYSEWRNGQPPDPQSRDKLVRNLLSVQLKAMKAYFPVPESADMKSFGDAVGKVVSDDMTDENGEMSEKKAGTLFFRYGWETCYKVAYNADSKLGFGAIESLKQKEGDIFGIGKESRYLVGNFGGSDISLDRVDKAMLPELRKRGAGISFSNKVENALFNSVVKNWSWYKIGARDKAKVAEIEDEEVMNSFIEEVGDNMARFLLEDMMTGKAECHVLFHLYKGEKNIESLKDKIGSSVTKNTIARYIAPLVYRGELQAHNFFDGLRTKTFADLVSEKDTQSTIATRKKVTQKVKDLVSKLKESHLTAEMKEKLRVKFRSSYEEVYGKDVKDEDILNIIETAFEKDLTNILDYSFKYVSSGMEKL